MTSISAESYDVICIGGALIGSAVAYFLTEDPSFDGTVLVVEPDWSYATASSSLSGSSIREQYSNPVNVRASQYGMEFMENFHERVQVDGESPELGFRGTGYLFLATDAGMPTLRKNNAVQVAEGAGARLLTQAELGATFPYMNTEGLAGGSLGSDREGSLDAWAMLQGFKQRAVRNGATYIKDRVTSIDVSDGRATAVGLESGRTVACGHVVNAAGPRASQVAAMVGVSLPVEPRKRTLFLVSCRVPIDGNVPLIITPEGVHLRREQEHYLTGAPPVEDPAVDFDDFDARRDEFEELVWPVLAERIPQFDRLSVLSSWAGHYAFNTLDHNMVIGPAPTAENFIFANGFSGHGLQQSPATGRGVSELIVDGAYRTLDLSQLGFERIVRNEPFLETAVI